MYFVKNALKSEAKRTDFNATGCVFTLFSFQIMQKIRKNRYLW
jgi:hypothetical protein